MMRRIFWVGVGAAAGITGYRRVTRGLSDLAARAAPAAAPADPVPAGPAAAGARLGLRLAQAGGRAARRQVFASSAGFLDDVRDGMSEFLDRHDPAAVSRRYQQSEYQQLDYVKDDR